MDHCKAEFHLIFFLKLFLYLNKTGIRVKTFAFKPLSCSLQNYVTMPIYPFLVVGDDTSHKVRLGVVQCGHKFGQRFLVQLSDCAEHPLLGL